MLTYVDRISAVLGRQVFVIVIRVIVMRFAAIAMEYIVNGT